MAKEELRAERLAKVAALRAMGIDPYGSRAETTSTIKVVRKMCPDEHVEGEPLPVVSVAGRVMAVRDVGMVGGWASGCRGSGGALEWGGTQRGGRLEFPTAEAVAQWDRECTRSGWCTSPRVTPGVACLPSRIGPPE